MVNLVNLDLLQRWGTENTSQDPNGCLKPCVVPNPVFFPIHAYVIKFNL